LPRCGTRRGCIDLKVSRGRCLPRRNPDTTLTEGTTSSIPVSSPITSFSTLCFECLGSEAAALRQKKRAKSSEISTRKAKKSTRNLCRGRYSYLVWSPSLLPAMVEDFRLRAVTRDFLGGLGKSSPPVKNGLSRRYLFLFSSVVLPRCDHHQFLHLLLYSLDREWGGISPGADALLASDGWGVQYLA
jgi:hypothetical protein